MRLAVLADVHDNLPTLEAIWDRAVNTFDWAEYGGESRRAEFV
ncbi:MAG: hypothetical protein ACOC7Y_02025 [Chloroflexota bacterium]